MKKATKESKNQKPLQDLLATLPLPHAKSSKCRGCALKKKGRTVVNTVAYGSGQTKLFVIGEAPGKTEAAQGKPFIGASGRILRRLLTHLNGGTLDGIAVGNVCRCLPLDDKSSIRSPTLEEATKCRSFLLKEIERLKPKQILLVGKTPLWALAEDPNTGHHFHQDSKIFTARGIDLVVKTPNGDRYPAICTLHPAYLLRNPKDAGIFEEDIRKIFLRLRKDYPDYSKRGKPAAVLDTLPKVKKYLKKLLKLKKKDIVALDFETKGVNRLNVQLLTVGFAHGPNRGYVIPYQHKESPWTGEEFKRLKKMLTRFFQTYDCTLVAHNLKFETNVIKDVFGVSIHDKMVECTMLRAHQLAENRGEKNGPGFGLKVLCEEWLQFYHYYDSDIAPVMRYRNDGKLDQVDLQSLAEYNAMDCYVEWRLYFYEHWFAEAAWGKKYQKEFRRYSRVLQGPASVFASYLERNGLAANKDQIRYFMSPESPILRSMAELEEKLKGFKSAKKANRILLKRRGAIGNMSSIWEENEAKGRPWIFSLNKPDARRVLYIDVLELKPVKQTDAGKPKIDSEFYKAHKGIPEVDVMREWMAFFKLKSTYIEGIYKRLQTHPDMRDGRIRGRLNLHKTVTGRTSFDKPNMQNIPRGKTEDAKEIKRLFIAGPGRVLVCGDYSQAEVRWMAQIAHDKKLIDQYKKVVKIHQEAARNPTAENGLRKDTEGDFHTSNAAIVFRKKPKDVTKNERGATKNIVFGNIYGQGITRLALAIGCSRDEAREFQKAFFKQFPDASKWLRHIEKVGFRDGKVDSPLGGRSRHLSSWFLLGEDFEKANNRRRDRKKGDEAIADDILLARKAFEDRASRNAPIQGVASDTNLLACIALTKYIEENGKDWWIVNVVHDSIIADIPFNEVPEYIKVAQQIMQDPKLFAKFDYFPEVPFMVDFSIGYTWGDQYDVSPIKTWKVKCKSGKKVKGEVCSGDKVYADKPVRCPRCHSKKVSIELVAGPAKTILKKLKKEKA